MAITSTESALGALIQAEVAKVDPLAAQDPKVLELWTAVANAIILHFVANAQVLPGIPVATAGGPTAQTGATTGPGMLV